jgi:hypothetical protein
MKGSNMNISALRWVFVCTGIVGLAALCAVSAKAEPFTGQTYTWIPGGSGFGPDFDNGVTRTFGSPATRVTMSGGLDFTCSDAIDSLDLPPGSLRLRFILEDVQGSPYRGTGSGAPYLVGDTVEIHGLALPSGSSFGDARIRYDFADGMNPWFNTDPWLFSVLSSGGFQFYASGGAYDPVFHPDQGAVRASYEIVINNVPEPLTVGLLGLGALSLLLRKRKAV